jgi:hypothetical protein
MGPDPSLILEKGNRLKGWLMQGDAYLRIMPNNAAALVLSRSHFVALLQIGESAKDTSTNGRRGP